MFTATFTDDGTSIHPTVDHAFTRHMQTIRVYAREAAALTGRAVTINMVGRARTVIMPDGREVPA